MESWFNAVLGIHERGNLLSREESYVKGVAQERTVRI